MTQLPGAPTTFEQFERYNEMMDSAYSNQPDEKTSNQAIDESQPLSDDIALSRLDGLHRQLCDVTTNLSDLYRRQGWCDPQMMLCHDAMVSAGEHLDELTLKTGGSIVARIAD